MPEFSQDIFVSGIADGSKRSYSARGYSGGAGYQDGIGVDYRSDRDKLGALKQLTKDSSTTVTDLVKWIIEYEGLFYMYGDSGKIYKRAENGTYTAEKTVSSSAGQGLEDFNQSIWYTSSNRLGKLIDPNAGTLDFYDNYFDVPDKQADDDINESVGANTYTLQTSINEGSTHRVTFTADAREYEGVVLNVVAKGTGDITITVHDSSNNALASVTVAAADTATGLRAYYFDQIAQTTVGDSYHVHVTVSTGTTTLRSDTTNELETAQHVILKYIKNDLVDQSSQPAVSDSQANMASGDISIGTTINESNKVSFTPTVEVLEGICVIPKEATPAGTWTLVVHDENNAAVGTATISAANMADTFCGWTKFSFTTPLRLKVDLEYHFHIYSSSGSQDVLGSSTTYADMYFLTLNQLILADDDFHPMKEFLNLLCIGSGNFLVTIDDAEVVTTEALIFPRSERIRCLEVIGDYLAVATWQGDDLGDYGQSKIYFWDGVSDTYNSFVYIDGQVNAMKNDGNNALYIVHGTEGQISLYTGGITPMRRIKGVGDNSTIEVYPQALNSWQGMLRVGISDGDSTTVDRVVWTYGRKDKDFPTALSKDYPISTGSKDSDVQIGAILGISSDKFFVSWKDDATYGVDIIDTANEQGDAFVQTLRIDAGLQYRSKVMTTLNVACEPLTANQSIEVYIRTNNAGSFTLLETINTENIQLHSIPIQDTYTRFVEVEFQFHLKYSSGTVAPRLLGYALEYMVDDEFQRDDVIAS